MNLIDLTPEQILEYHKKYDFNVFSIKYGDFETNFKLDINFNKSFLEEQLNNLKQRQEDISDFVPYSFSLNFSFDKNIDFNESNIIFYLHNYKIYEMYYFYYYENNVIKASIRNDQGLFERTTISKEYKKFFYSEDRFLKIEEAIKLINNLVFL